MAINFPATAGQPTDGTFTYVVAGITYSWNGESWRAAGSGATATDRTVFSVSQNPASGTGTLTYNSNQGVFSYTPPALSGFLTAESDTLQSVTARGSTSNVSLTLSSTLNVNSELHVGSSMFRVIANSPSGYVTLGNVSGTGGVVLRSGQGKQVDFTNESGTNTFATISDTGTTLSGALTAGGLTYPTSNGTLGQSLTSNGQGSVIWQTIDGLKSRTFGSVTVVALANNGVSNQTISTAKTYVLHSIETSHAAWVTLYTDTTSRTNDASRAETTDPLPGSGVIAEVITTGAVTQKITPGVIGFNSSGSTDTYLKIVNKSGSTNNIIVTLNYVQLEA